MGKSKKNTGNIFLAGIAFVLAGLAFAIASPEGLNNVNRQPNFIGVLELAERIKNREDFQLIDLRDSASYADFHIPRAVSIQLEDFSQVELTTTTIIYSGDDLLARRLWDSLDDSSRNKVSILYGGIHDWYDRLQYPTLPFGDEVKNMALFKQIHDLCQFYGGYAEFEADSTLLDYYKLDLSDVKWSKSHREGALVRKGC